MTSEIKFHQIENVIYCKLEDNLEYKFKINPLPEKFIEWQSKSRVEMLKFLESGKDNMIKVQPAHLPVLATKSDGPFPINLTTKGMGLLPKKEYLEKFTNLFRSTIEKYISKPWRESLIERMKVAVQFYESVDHFDNQLLGGLEIFEGKTPQNLKQYPLASLLYTGEAPKFPSYQFNGLIEFIDKKNPYYEFLLAARELFAFDAFHIKQYKYPFGYLFYTIEIKNKTPFSRKR